MGTIEPSLLESSGAGGAPASTCPYCAEAIQPGARKCPHCREILDADLRREVEQQMGEGIARSLAAQELRERILHSVIASSVGLVMFCVAGALFGPCAFLFALYYRRRVRQLEMDPPSALVALYVLSAAWTLVGVLFVVLLAVNVT